jgi:hypothetical protein
VLGAQVRAFRLGDERTTVRFRVRTVEVTLGWPYKGRVEYSGAPSVWRRAVITLAGGLADLAVAGLLLAGAATISGTARPLVMAAVLGFGVTGVRAFLPYRSRSGRLSDGARLLELRADAEQALDIATRLRREGRIGELLELHAGLRVPDGPRALEQTYSLHAVEWNLLLVPDLSAPVIDQAARRVQWVLANYPFDTNKDLMTRPQVEHTMALARLRQGRFAEVEPWCESALSTDLGPQDRATVLATIAMARQLLGQPYADLLAEAVALSPQADLVPEASALVPNARPGEVAPIERS